MIRLTTIQRSNIDELEARGRMKVRFAGLDQRDCPVVEVTGGHGVKLIAWTPGGPGRAPKLPLRDFTESECEQLHPDDSELLFGLKWAVGEYLAAQSTQAPAAASQSKEQ